MRKLDRAAARRRTHAARAHLPSLVAGAMVLVPASVLACPSCFSSTSERVLQTYYLTATFLTLMPFLVLGVLGTWVANRDRRQRINGRAPGDVPERSER